MSTNKTNQETNQVKSKAIANQSNSGNKSFKSPSYNIHCSSTKKMGSPDVVEPPHIIVNKYGTIVSKVGENPTEVYLDSFSCENKLGDLKTGVNVDGIFENLLVLNGNTADRIYNPFSFRSRVRAGGIWDYKVQTTTIYGYGNSVLGDDAKFTFNGVTLAPQDIGNYHFGFVGKAFGWFSEKFMLQRAGQAQMNSGTSKPEWQKYTTEWHGNSAVTKMLPPYGDDPRDQGWIKEGFDHYDGGGYGF